jgi:hypothetical protein
MHQQGLTRLDTVNLPKQHAGRQSLQEHRRRSDVLDAVGQRYRYGRRQDA